MVCITFTHFLNLEAGASDALCEIIRPFELLTIIDQDCYETQ
jgi:hypothetical protein